MITTCSLVVEKAVYQYNGHNLLTVDSLSLPSQGVGLVVGRNGAGKTLLLYLLAGRLPCSSGSVVLQKDHSVIPLSDTMDSKHSIRFMTDQFLGDKQMSVHSYLSQMALIYDHFSKNDEDEGFQHVMNLCDLERLGHTEIKRLSLGEQRRLSIAGILLGSSCFMMMDEPFSGLDATQAKKMRAVLKKRALTTGVILSGHDWHTDVKMADYILLVKSGAVEYYDTSSSSLAQIKKELFGD